MNETQAVLYKLLRKYGPQSHYSLYHTARAKGHKFSPSGVRSRVAEMVKMGVVEPSGKVEATPSGRSAKLWKAL